MIKLWSFIYRHTGYFSPFAELAEYRYLMTQIKEIEKRYNHKKNDMTLDNHIGITIGMWQGDYGFVREWKHVKKELDAARKKRKKK